MKKSLIRTAICIMILSLAAALAACSSGAVNSRTSDMKSYEELNDPSVKLGCVNGTVSGQLAEEQIPEAEVMYYNTVIDMITALENGKIDAIIDDSCTIIYYNRQIGGKLRLLDDYLKPFQFGFIFAKTAEGNRLAAEMSEFIDKIRADGTLKEIDDNWMSADGAAEMAVDYNELPAANGVLKLSTTGTSPPFSYLQDDVIIGYDIDIASRFCKEYGYGLEVGIMSFDGIIPAVSSGKYDFGGNQISITEERKESVEFSSPYYDAGTAAAVYNAGSGGGGFFGNLKESFNKTFIREDRWKLFASGILTTLLITVLSVIFGTILGFLIYMCCRNGNRFANRITSICTALIQGLPVVVVLMILFYIVFAKAPVSGVFVSVVAFTLIFAASVYAMLCTGVSAIDKGQTEGAMALGFSDLEIFFKVVLPQAMAYILPLFKGELVALIKATAIVGYIAVQDLTRMGDIVRSRTYEAFFPLIAVAIIYFVLARFLIFLVGRMEYRIDPKRRDREEILKGVNVHD